MTPIDFIHGEIQFNVSLGLHQEALTRPIQIVSADKKWEILSYYLGEDGRYYLDIQEK